MSNNAHSLEVLTNLAAQCILNQEPVVITNPPGWERNGFPLPIKRNKAAADGSVTQEYRPMAILEYVNDVLSGELSSRRKTKSNEQQQDDHNVSEVHSS